MLRNPRKACPLTAASSSTSRPRMIPPFTRADTASKFAESMPNTQYCSTTWASTRGSEISAVYRCQRQSLRSRSWLAMPIALVHHGRDRGERPNAESGRNGSARIGVAALAQPAALGRDGMQAIQAVESDAAHDPELNGAKCRIPERLHHGRECLGSGDERCRDREYMRDEIDK